MTKLEFFDKVKWTKNKFRNEVEQCEECEICDMCRKEWKEAIEIRHLAVYHICKDCFLRGDNENNL